MTGTSLPGPRELRLPDGRSFNYHSLPDLETAGLGAVSRLPVSIRVVLESVLRNCDGAQVTEDHVRSLAGWAPNGARTEEIPFKVARVVLQDFTGVPLLADLAAMRDAAVARGDDPARVEPLVPVDLVVDHSVQVDRHASADALRLNMEIEFERNQERYKFLKWGMNAFETFRVIPPGVGIVHQVNLEHLATGVVERDGMVFPDTLVGADSHTTMINGIGVVGWGVGGIEAEAAMLGQPVNFLTPDVVGFRLVGELRPGTTATDLVLTVTEILRRESVVGKFVEFFGEGARSLSVPDRATIGNMAPEYGATMGFFPVDEKTLEYYRSTGRDESLVGMVRAYFEAQGMFGIPGDGECDYTKVVELDLGTVRPSVAGPRRPQDRIPLDGLKERFLELRSAPQESGGYGKAAEDDADVTVEGEDFTVRDGSVLIAAITSCTNTSNPSVLLAAGLLAKKATAQGLRVHPRVKTSFAPGSRVVTDYLAHAGLLDNLQQLGFHVVGYGCTTCIGNSGPLDPAIEKAVVDNNLVAASVLSGNRNFEARVHQSVKANFLMSPPLVVAFAIAGRVDIDLDREPIGENLDGKPVYLRDVWPTNEEIAAEMGVAADPEGYRRRYSADSGVDLPLWDAIDAGSDPIYSWDDSSTYIRRPPFFSLTKADHSAGIRDARALAVFGDVVTTDHISPAGAIKPSSPAGLHLRSRGVSVSEFNSYGSRRGSHEVMMRGTFANVRIRNLMLPGTEGGITVHLPGGEEMPIHDAAMLYQREGTPLVIFAGSEYGTGSSRDWAAKGTRLLGVRAVVAKSFERIHRSNLVGLGVLPFQFAEGEDAGTLGLTGRETYDITLDGGVRPRGSATLRIRGEDHTERTAKLLLRVDTPSEVECLEQDGLLPLVLGRLFETEKVE